MTKSFEVIIVGGGIAGLSAAIALRKDDRRILVLEQSSLSREIGATISLQPNASKIVERQWGLEATLKAKGSMIDRGFQIYNLNGELQMKIPLNTTQRYGSERVVYHRVDLHEALKSRAQDPLYPGKPAELRVSSRVTACDTTNGTIKLENGERLKADLIVAADGIRSVVREEVLGTKVQAIPTGHSAYRILIPMKTLKANSLFSDVVDPAQPFTTMVMGHDKRLIMGPARGSTLYSVVAMVPDDSMAESSDCSTWNTKADLPKMLLTFKDFPAWARVPLELSEEAGLWQLRDIDPLPTWYKGRAILIGDAAHAMLPTQGQGASQSVEDAEALGACFGNIVGEQTAYDVEAINKVVFEIRYDRATLIQTYSRQAAMPATDAGSNVINMNPGEFMDYNCQYDGAVEWYRKMKLQAEAIKGEELVAPLKALNIAL